MTLPVDANSTPNYTAAQHATHHDTLHLRFNSDPDSYPTSANAADYEFDVLNTSSLPAGWSWMNQGTSTYLEDQGWGGIIIPSQGSDNIRAIMRAVPAASTYTITWKLAMAGKNANSLYGGPLFRDSVGGKSWGYYWRHDGTIGGVEFSNNTSVASTFGTINQVQGFTSSIMYFRVKKNSATSFDLQYSPNGVHWLDVQLARNESGFVVADTVGFYANPSNNAQSLIACEFFRVT